MNVHHLLEWRGELQRNFNEVGAEQWCGVRRLRPADYEIAYLGAQMMPVEGKRTHLDSSPGRILCGRNDFLPHKIAEPLRLYDHDACDSQYGNQAGERAQHDDGNFLNAPHSNASFLNTTRV